MSTATGVLPLVDGRTTIMGILNVTPDSFSDGGLFVARAKAVDQARKMIDDGADIIDVGGESTRPGAASVTVGQELERVIPVIEAICARFPVAVSVDTSKAEVMSAAVDAGAAMINDVRALQEPGALAAAAQAGVAVCLMHMQGQPRTMQQSPNYADVVTEVRDFLGQRVQDCVQAGIPPDLLITDPGFGFGKTREHNFRLLRELSATRVDSLPILVGLSRKSMIGQTLELPVDDRVAASIALALLAVINGANIVRVHDVRETWQALRMQEAVLKDGGGR
jgi:dihydropteroate synthase